MTPVDYQTISQQPLLLRGDVGQKTYRREQFILNNRTLVKVSAGEHCIGFKTVSRMRKSEREFLVTRSEFEQLEQEGRIIVCDIHSFAVLRRDILTGMLHLNFSWLRGGCNSQLTGWEETVTLPYDALIAFIQASAQEGSSKKWRALSVQKTASPKIEFCDKDGLHKCLENRTVRGKLARALRDNFHGSERVIFYHDSEAYSFIFQSFRGDRPTITGGLILHRQDDLKKAYYSVHT